MTRPLRPLLFALVLLSASCSESTGSASKPQVEVTAVTRVIYAERFPALTFTLANRGVVAADNVAIDVDALRSGTIVAQSVTTVSGLGPGESAVSDPAVLATLDSHADYDCYRYRVRTYDQGGQTTSDRRSAEVCP
jgi:hypothetical protein